MQLNFHRQGQGTPIVLLHGLLGSWENLNNVAKSLAQNFDVIAIDLPNHGSSPHTDDVGYPQMAAEVCQLMDNLDIQTFAVLGHSMGGKVAMQLAIDKPQRIERLIVVDVAPVAYTSKHNRIFAALMAIDLDKLDSRKATEHFLQPLIPDIGVRQFLLKSLVKQQDRFTWRFNLKGLVDNYASICKSIEGNGSYLGQTLFIKGSNSDYLLAEHRDTILNYFPNSKARIINDAGHWVHAEKPAMFNRLVNGFLSFKS
ncbi:MAG: esterase [Alteromonadaceae bacterium]|jgi:esterase